MAEKSILDQIGDKVQQEALSARDSMAKLFDTTKQTYETYVGYPKEHDVDVSQQMGQQVQTEMDMDK